MWCGPRKSVNLNNRLVHQIKRHRAKKSRIRGWKPRTFGQAHKRYMGIHIPSPWNFILFRKTYRKRTQYWLNHAGLLYKLLFMYSATYYCMCPLPFHWRTHQQNRFNFSAEITARQVSHYVATYFTKFYTVFSALHRPFFHKLKFKGKGYYMYRNRRNTITPQLGHAHRILTYTFYLGVRFFKRGTTRRSIVLTGLLKEHLHKAAWNIRQMRRQNIFTGRGVRFSRGSIYKKPGKISTYR